MKIKSNFFIKLFIIIYLPKTILINNILLSIDFKGSKN